MEVMFGFGPYHEDQTRALVARLADDILSRPNELPEIVAKRFMADLGTYKDKGWNFGRIRWVTCDQRHESARIIMVEGQHSHYRDDHPMSPDGYASATFPFCLTICMDDIWHPRFYIALNGQRPKESRDGT